MVNNILPIVLNGELSCSRCLAGARLAPAITVVAHEGWIIYKPQST